MRSRRRCSQPLQLHHTAHIVRQVFEPDAGLSANNSYTAHQRPTHVVGLSTKNMFHANTNFLAGLVALLFTFAQRLMPAALAVDAARQAFIRQHLFNLR